MGDSILDSTKKILGLSSGYTTFDHDIITYINSAFSVLDQLGVGPVGGYMITDNIPTWNDFVVPANQLNLVRTYVFLRVKMLFDPPTTSFLIEAMNNQRREYEWRLSALREDVEHPLDELLEAREQTLCPVDEEVL